ncbi:HesA/MoeB/ThiF family protein [Streptomyces sp. NPDC002845]
MKIPRVKPEHTPHRFPDGTIRIGGAGYGIAAEIRDPGGWVWDTLTRMDGVTPVERIEAELAAAHPGLGDNGVRTVMSSLFGSGYVEDMSEYDQEGLTAREVERYSRNHSYFRRVDLRPGTNSWEPQRRLKNSRVVILGLRGTGSHASWALAAAGVGRIHLVDPDVVEESNLTRQALYGEEDLGRPKAEVAARRLRSVNSSAAYTCAVEKVDTEDGLGELVAGCDVFALRCAGERSPRRGRCPRTRRRRENRSRASGPRNRSVLRLTCGCRHWGPSNRPRGERLTHAPRQRRTFWSRSLLKRVPGHHGEAEFSLVRGGFEVSRHPLGAPHQTRMELVTRPHGLGSRTAQRTTSPRSTIRRGWRRAAGSRRGSVS